MALVSVANEIQRGGDWPEYYPCSYLCVAKLQPNFQESCLLPEN